MPSPPEEPRPGASVESQRSDPDLRAPPAPGPDPPPAAGSDHAAVSPSLSGQGPAVPSKGTHELPVLPGDVDLGSLSPDDPLLSRLPRSKSAATALPKQALVVHYLLLLSRGV